jgi:riboflavin kinase/FMN adenylyltransferase
MVTIMKLLRSLQNFPKNYEFVATIGTYDGIHLGHQEILQRVKELAQQNNLASLVILFEPQPAEFLQDSNIPPRITTIREKVEILQSYHIDQILCLRFNRHLQSISATEFVEEILYKLNIKFLVIGDDFAFGHNREGNANFLQNYAKNFHVEIMPQVSLHGLRISSTHIRQALLNGDFELAATLLGRNYSISGKIGYGDHFGHVLGFPTANIYLQHKVLPIAGVYAVKVEIQNVPITDQNATGMFGAANVGFRPTVDGKLQVLEVHILNFDRDIYGKRIRVEFLHKIRSEQKFASLDALKQQIKADIDAIQKYFDKTQPIDK